MMKRKTKKKKSMNDHVVAIHLIIHSHHHIIIDASLYENDMRPCCSHAASHSRLFEIVRCCHLFDVIHFDNFAFFATPRASSSFDSSSFDTSSISVNVDPPATVGLGFVGDLDLAALLRLFVLPSVSTD